MKLDQAYIERVYAGVLGKIIGVYLGRPFEGWTYERIMEELGEINYYVHGKLGKSLIVADDDISGTFTFVRALADYGYNIDITPRQIGQTWLNYLIENRTILWWGGMGNSTEHTAYLRLKKGIHAPKSGSMELNGKVVSEQIGSQIFIDAWAMLCPGDPGLAADLAKRAASVSHDGEAIYGAQMIASMEAAAFVEPDIGRLIDIGVAFIPSDSVIYRMIHDIREWHSTERDWRKTRALLEAHYGYAKYGGNCHIVPNHGLIILSLLYGDDDFQKTLMIVNTCGWDTDCNSANVGCLLGIKNGLEGIDAGADFRGPIADRLYMPSADGGRAITDCVIETYHVVNTARALVGQASVNPKNGARFHFELPGSVQGFVSKNSTCPPGMLHVENTAGHSRLGGRSLALKFRGVTTGQVARVATPTFIPRDALGATHHFIIASPTLYPGQIVKARVEAHPLNNRPVDCGLYISVYNANDGLSMIAGPKSPLKEGAEHELSWLVPDTGGQPIAEVGLEITSNNPATGTIYLDYLTWDQVPRVTWGRPHGEGTVWRRAWVNGLDKLEFDHGETYRMIQNSGTGLMIQGAAEWADYSVAADLTPHMCEATGVAARVQGMRRYYGLLLYRGGLIRLVKALDGTSTLGETQMGWEPGETYHLRLEVVGNRLKGWLDGRCCFDLVDEKNPLTKGAVALVVREGRTACNAVSVAPQVF